MKFAVGKTDNLPPEVTIFNIVIPSVFNILTLLPATGDFCRLLITFANSLDADQVVHMPGIKLAQKFREK